ncbi:MULTISPECIES: hypothetical protein [unclassified Streptomyces]|uniref:hypothetical protein n=1 Tax=unclassified Streptomyces TaxID=2593676 RepID=UPI002DD95A99|nr:MULTISPECIES: hypothetical protein [unclassified Streptomyces]WSA95066.1 hypothetical protein OIE63_28570 [Streptomyces sp. NBC_01795]WSB79486.1 hypothetical protein OHB04_29685 [Streptomyces sp. NBC_01775]WSS12309.1 hypothetical protein OG533_10530 [Streptomyces sp. NBC_01186]WSS41021.1 hypothetical protein OG220_10680 [Streptomyces sp. NBC_01187]
MRKRTALAAVALTATALLAGAGTATACPDHGHGQGRDQGRNQGNSANPAYPHHANTQAPYTQTVPKPQKDPYDILMGR